MKWIEIVVHASHAATEAVAEIFSGLGSGGVTLEDPRVLNSYLKMGLWDYTELKEQEDKGITIIKAYLPVDGRLKERLQKLDEELAEVNKHLPNATAGNIAFREMNEEDWESAWKQYFHPVRIGRKIVIKPTWEEYEKQAGDLVIEIDPGMAFGTGTHHTTSLCLAQLEDIVQKGQTVFDVGTGSGILALACAMLGAEKVVAVDFDDTAVKIARENVALNRLQDKIEVFGGDLLSTIKGKADIIVANIVANVICELVRDIPARLVTGGFFLASGIIEDRIDEVKEKAFATGLKLIESRQSGIWVMLLFVKE